MPILFRNELFDFALARGHQLQRHRLNPARAEPAPHLVPEERAEFVADEPVEDAARALGGDHFLVEDARVFDRFLNRLLRNLVEHQAVKLALLAGKLLRQMPADRLALAIGVGRHVAVGRVLGGVLQFLDDLLARHQRLVLFGEIVVDVHTQFALGQIADVPHRRHHLVVAAEILVDGLRLGRRFDNDERFCHESLFRP